jgi:hypothetical protein
MDAHNPKPPPRQIDALSDALTECMFDVERDFDDLAQTLSFILLDLRPIHQTMDVFAAGGPKCARTIEQIYEKLCAFEVSAERSASMVCFALNDAIGVLEDMETAEAPSGADMSARAKPNDDPERDARIAQTKGTRR